MGFARDWWRRRGMEAVLALVAALGLLGYLGAVDLWGKREQRSSAEAIDTIDHGHWLVARIQGRPRLEKPPLPRWTIAALIRVTGRRDEWMVRLPGALGALGTVGLVYALGCRLGGRSVGLASGLALASSVFFVAEVRQAGNDAPLVFFTTAALYAAWRRLHGDDGGVPAPGRRRWAVAMYGALGLGVLTKGPVVVALVGLTVVPYLATARRLRQGLRLLADGPGLALFLALALSWPVPVLIADPNAARVWYLEMGQKAASAGVTHHRSHTSLLAAWPWMTAPWGVVASMALVFPFRGAGRGSRPAVWFPWWWSVGNLAMFSLWSVAKASYFLPCLPGVALLIGTEWTSLARAARGDPASTRARLARGVLRAHWVVLLAAAVAGASAAPLAAPGHVSWALGFAAVVAVAVAASARAWRRGADAGALAPLSAAVAAGVLIAYGGVAPGYNPSYSHRGLAAALERLVPPGVSTIMFLDEVDEGLWFYLRGRELVPVPGSQPRYNTADYLYEAFRTHRLEYDPEKRLRRKAELLDAWAAGPARPSPYVLMRRKLYERIAGWVETPVTPILREEGLDRYEMVLLRVEPPAPLAARGGSGETALR